MKVKEETSMFNSRDDYCEIDYNEIYNPYAVDKFVENRKTREIARIIYIDDDIATLQMNVDKDLDSTDYLDISTSKLKSDWKKCEKIIIGKLPKNSTSIHLDFKDVGFEVIGKSLIVPKKKVKNERRNVIRN